MVNAALSQISNNFMYSAMIVYFLAFMAFCAEWAFGSTSKVGQRTAALGRAAEVHREVAAGRSGTTATVATVRAAPPGPEPSVAAGDGRADRYGRIAISLAVLAFGLHLLSMVTRGMAAHRVPWGNMYEFSAMAALAVSGVFLMLLARGGARWLGIFVVALVLVTLAIARLVLYTDNAQLVPALQSYWLSIHVSAAIISSGVFTVAGIASLLYLLKERSERQPAARQGAGPRRVGMLERLPEAGVLDRISYRMIAFVFPLWTFAVIAGAIWAENAWGRYWGWDPKETWAFITWVIYAAYLHARATAGWKGRSAAYISLLGLLAFLFNYFGVNIFITGLHSYAGIG
jgi:cytochrome c-type biogenesis protein CcsB